MNSGTSTLDAAAVLASARRARATANAAEVQVLADAIAWAHLHEVSELEEAATWWDGSATMGRDTGIPIAGEGAPLVSEFAVAEFATALGLSAESGRRLLGQALELAHRLPKTWARVQAGSLAPWRARRIAEHTSHLTLAAVSYVDQMIAPFAHKTGPTQTIRLIETAIAQYMPDHAAEVRDRAAEQRYFTIDHDQVSFAGTSRIHGELDLADALDLEDALRRGAEDLKALGNEESLDVRRSLAAGILARGQQPLQFEQRQATGVSTGSTTGVSTGSTTGVSKGSTTVVSTGSTTEGTGVTTGGVTRSREVVLYVHLSEDALRSGHPDASVWVENAGGQLLTAAQLARWCGRADTSKITVKPVIDLTQPHAVDGYQVPERIAEHVRLRDRTCVHPWCQRAARFCDLDHIVAYDPDGPPGQTSTWNLALLCRRHHRLKTHGGWTYSMIRPGVFLWRGPHGHTWLRDASGTTDLTPPPVDPPPRRTS